MPPLWLIKAGAALALLAGVFGAGAYTHMRFAEAKAARLALQASEQARKTEREDARSSILKLDNYAAEQRASEARALSARSDLEQLRSSLAAVASPAASAACGPDGRLAGIARLLDEGAGLVEEGARHVEELRAKRDALR